MPNVDVEGGGLPPLSARPNGKAPASWRTPYRLGLALLLTACATPQQDRLANAQKLFAHAVTAHANNQYRAATADYRRLLRQYSDQPALCAAALRSLGNVRAAQGRLDEAVKLYRRVGVEYAAYDWEVLQAWKSAGDLLWEAGREAEACEFYRQIVARFDTPDAPAVYRQIIKGAQRR
jgi:tetratricopeptide (TPR) repeat protein